MCLMMLLVSSCSHTVKPDNETEDSSGLNKTPERTVGGSAGDLEGRTIVITIFGSDDRYSWEYTYEDKPAKTYIRDYLDIAGTYLEHMAADYGKKALFITDFIENQDLSYDVVFDQTVVSEQVVYYGDIDYLIWDFIDENIDEEALREEYEADNVVYLLIMNTDVDNEVSTCTRNWYYGMPSNSEVVYLFNIDYGVLHPPAVYVHEILHTFGAPDLYMEQLDYGITNEFVYYVRDNLPNDIMYTCSDRRAGTYLYDRITNEYSDLTAYFVGLTDHCDIVDEWGLTDPYR